MFPRLHKGHALPEFLAMGVVLVPLYLMVPLMGKVADLNHAAIQASRYAAWERTVAAESDKPETELLAEVQRRFFQKSDLFIKSGEGVQTGDANRNVLWSGYGEDRLLRSAAEDVSLTTRNDATPGTMGGTVTRILAGIADAMDEFNSGAQWDIDNNGLYQADISVNVGSNRMGFTAGEQNCAGQDSSTVFVCIRRHNVILADGWSARDPEQAGQRVKSFVPMGVFDSVRPIFQGLSILPILQELDTFDPGIVAPDVVPPDRLGRYRE